MSSHAIDLTTHGRELKKQYDAVVSSDPEVTWAVFKYRPKDTVLAPQASGDGDLDEFVAEFDEAMEQFGIVQVDVGTIKKVVLVGWLGEGVADGLRLGFNTHTASVARYFSGHHVQITARSADELTPELIMRRVNNAAGSKYSHAGKPTPATKPKFIRAEQGAAEDDWGETVPLKERDEPSLDSAPSAYKPTRAEVISSKPAKVQGLDSSSSYKPVGKVDIQALRDAAKKDKFADARVEKIESSYKPVGKVDIAAIRAEARKDEQRKLKASGASSSGVSASSEKSRFLPENKEESKSSYQPEEGEEYMSLADRMKAFRSQVEAAKPQSIADPARNGHNGTSRVDGAAAKFGGGGAAKKLPPHLAGGVETSAPTPGSRATQAFKDFGSVDGKSPAQQWAEKRGKFKASSSEEQKAAAEASDDDDGDRELEEKVSRLSHRTAAELEEPDEREADSSPKFADLTKKFASASTPKSQAVPAAPVRASQREPEPELGEEEDDGLVAIVELDYEEDPEDDNEISLIAGERITNIEKLDENWWAGRNSKGLHGMFPAEYVKLESESSSASAGPSTAPRPSAATPPSAKKDTTTATAEYDYDAEDDDELTFKTGDIISDIEFVDPDWWTGTAHGKTGLFPKDFVSLQS